MTMLKAALRSKGLERTVQNNMVLVSGIPLMLVIVVIALYLSRAAISDYERGLADSADKSAQLINAELQTAMARSDVIVQNAELIEALQDDYDGDVAKMMKLYKHLELLVAAPSADSRSSFFTVYPFNPTIYQGSYVEKYEKIAGLGIDARLSALGEGALLWTDAVSVRKYRDNAEFVQFYRPIKAFTTTVGILEANISFERIRQIIDNTVIPEKAIMALTKASGEVQYVRGPLPEGGLRDGRLDEARFTTAKVPLANSQLLVSAVPSAVIAASVLKLALLMALVMALALGLMLVISQLSARIALRKLKQFLDLLKGDDKLLMHRPPGAGQDDHEITIIERKLREVLTRNQELHEESAQARLERSRFELELLQARINPHLLYNSLSVIKWNASWNRDKRTAELIDHMTKYYRIALSKGNTFITMADELAMVKDYVRINEFSYNARYELLVEVEAPVMRCRIFKHMLQPIVENSILHGLNGREAGGIIRIEGYRSGEELVVRVSDNGNGMNEDKIRQILDGQAGSALGGYGIKNLLKRIHMHFGDSYGLSIASSPAAGTQVTLRIPAALSGEPWNG